MRAHYLQHVSFEGLGSIEGWLHQRGYQITSTPLHDNTASSPPFPDSGAIELLVVLGGPMSVHDELQYPWLREERSYIREIIDSGTPTLGICLGAQLIAASQGSAIYRNGESEIGWFDIHWHPSALTRHIEQQRQSVFHWHGETFDLPPGAELLASSEGCRNQGFQLGRTVVGLQFHLETTPNAAQAIVENCGAEITPGRYMQGAETILEEGEGRYQEVNQTMGRLLDYLTQAS